MSADRRRSELYDSYMSGIPISEARERLAEIVEDAHRSGEPITLTRRGRPVAIVVDPAVWERVLDRAEDAIDQLAIAEATDQDEWIPWEQVKEELGLS